jgi:circadian clock protein KaiC
MRSIGIDLQPFVEQGLLQFHANRPTFAGLETHLTVMHQAVSDFKPQVVIIDPLSSFLQGDNGIEVEALVMRLVDFLKTNQITAFFTSLNHGGEALEATSLSISSLIDTWILLRDIELNGERDRGLYILKSRGMAHSNQIREFLITDQGIDLRDVYVGPGGVLTGSARLAQEAQERADQNEREHEMERRQLEMERKRKALDLQIASLRTEFELEEAEYLKAMKQTQAREERLARDRLDMGRSRKADVKSQGRNGGSK